MLSIGFIVQNSTAKQNFWIGQIFLAIEMAVESKDSQVELWERISKDEYMKYAVVECYYTVENVLKAILDDEGRLWYDVYDTF